MKRRDAALLMAAALVSGGTVRAQAAFPNRTVKLINPFPAGSPVDVVARLLAQKLSEGWGQSVVVENKAGAGGTMGSEQVARSPADGYTLLVTSASSHVIAPSLRKAMPYDAVKDFIPISLVAHGPTAIVVHPSLPVKNLAEFVAYAKANPGKVAYASSGTGTILHLTGELFASKTGVDLLHVPYKGAVPASTDLIGGQVQAMFDSINNAMPHVRSGRLRALAVVTPNRSSLLPDVPTAIEQGFQGLEFPAWIGVFAPAGTPEEVINTLNKALLDAMNSSAIKAKLQVLGLEATPSTPKAMGEYAAKERAKWGPLIKATGIKAD